VDQFFKIIKLPKIDLNIFYLLSWQGNMWFQSGLIFFSDEKPVKMKKKIKKTFYLSF